MKNSIYNFLLLLFKFLNMILGEFWRSKAKPYFHRISIYSARIRFLFRSINFIKFGKDCSLGKKVILNCSKLELGTHVTLRSHVQVSGKGKLNIGDNTTINEYSIISCQKSITIGSNVMLAPYVYILDVDHEFKSIDVPITQQGYTTSDVNIGDNVWIGTNTIITKGVTIGEGSIVGCNSVVTKNIAPFSIVAGSPAKLIKMRKS